MRGEERRQRAIWMVMEPGDRVPREHPLRRVKELADAALTQLSPLLDDLYSAIGRPSIPPEWLLKASLLMALHTVRSERLFCEQIDYNLLFRWFLDMDAAEPSFDHFQSSRGVGTLGEILRAKDAKLAALLDHSVTPKEREENCLTSNS